MQNASNWSNDRLWQNIIPTLGQIISETKCDRDKPFFLQKEGLNQIELGINRDPMGSDNVQKGYQLHISSLPPSASGTHAVSIPEHTIIIIMMAIVDIPTLLCLLV